MRNPVRIGIAASLLAISFMTACSDSTGPSGPTAAQTATHFDSIAIQAQAQSDTNSAYGTRTFLATLIELPAALGATPATVSVTTANGNESWKAYELLELTPAGSTPDSSYAVLMFRDADAHTALIVFYDSTGTAEDGGLITADTILVSPSDGSGTTSLTSVSSGCTTPSSSLLNPALGTFLNSACSLAQFHTTLSLTMPTTPGMDAALTSLSYTNASVNGVRVVDQAGGASVRRLHEIMHTMASRRRH
jgi:hypothetical protein